MDSLLPKKCHFIGIGGIGMSGLARLMLRQNIAVTGSDPSQNASVQELVKLGARVAAAHAEDNVSADSIVVYSSSIREDNAELRQAKKLGCEVLHRSDLLQRLMATKKTLAVAGTHGKTTTTALLSMVLREGLLDPSFMVGGIVSELMTNADAGDGDYFVAEADESDGSFLKYAPFGAIITNFGLDHLDHYQTEKILYQAFHQFAGQVSSPDHLFWCGDDNNLRRLRLPGFSYGFGECDLRLSKYRQQGWSSTFDIEFQGRLYEGVEAALPGRHNALNAAAVFGLALVLGVSEGAARKALKSFGGVRRRCEKKGEASGVLFLDDYAHHPTEIAAALESIRKAVHPRKLKAIFQPHRPSRMRHCFGNLKECFKAADEVWVADIYMAGESPIPGVSREAIVDEIPRSRVFDEEAFCQGLRPHDVVVTLGAGDVTGLGQKLFERSPFRKLKVALIRGGASVEHDISRVSAKFVEESLSSELYEVTVMDISREGKWCGGWLEMLESADVAFPVLHGPFGEDGTIQGLFEMLRIPYVGCSHRAAAIAMDKCLTKQLAVLNGVRTPPFVRVDKWSKAVEEEVLEELRFPVFVKALHLGSSIGVVKVAGADDLEEAVHEVLKIDTGLIVEQGISGRELEFAVLGDEAFPPGEILTHGEAYDFEKKYGPDGFKTTSDPDLTADQVKQGQELALRAFQAIGGEGMARVDFFLDPEGRFWLNEINPIPGFTAISLYPKQCEKAGVPPNMLMDRLIQWALYRDRERARCG